AAVVEASLPSDAPRRNWSVAAGAALSLTPDLDFMFLWWLDLGRDWHRGFTHSILFALGASAVLYLVRSRRGMREGVAMMLALLSHCVLDFLTSTRSAGVALLWPFSSERHGLGWTQLLEPEITASTLRDIISTASRISLLEAAMFLPIFTFAWFARHRLLLRQSA
ncbi:MAG TPA: metal-dependent hydrolase, partial [Steroidobacter sp.]|nr:metal-dependent hydrolase [Steroidobacter sp.]